MAIEPAQFKQNLINVVIFICGAATLIVEVTAIRLLSPYFGATLFNLSSIISVIMIALAIGYWLGGKFADQKPSPTLLYGIVLVSGTEVLLLNMLSIFLLPILGGKLDLMAGPLLASLMLFFLPTLFLGMVSPIAIRIQTKGINTVGETAGRVFFFGTAGSVVGSLGAGFIFIPHFPVSKIIAGTGIVLVAVGLAGISRSLKTKALRKIGVLMLILGVLSGTVKPVRTEPDTLVEEDSMYQHIKIIKTQFQGGEGLLLMLDKTFAGARYLDSDELPFPYTRYHELYVLANKQAKRFLYLGGGTYVIPKKLLAERKDELEVVAVEIDPRLPELARLYFSLTDDPRLKLVTADARKFLSGNLGCYDMIFVDVFSMDFALPPHLATAEFFKIIEKHLCQRGTIVMNIATSIENKVPSCVPQWGSHCHKAN